VTVPGDFAVALATPANDGGVASTVLGVVAVTSIAFASTFPA
jgi:hypothetical protein